MEKKIVWKCSAAQQENESDCPIVRNSNGKIIWKWIHFNVNALMFCSTNSKYICLYLSVDDALQCFLSATAQNTNRIETNASLIFWGHLRTSTFPRSLDSLFLLWGTNIFSADSMGTNQYPCEMSTGYNFSKWMCATCKSPINANG